MAKNLSKTLTPLNPEGQSVPTITIKLHKVEINANDPEAPAKILNESAKKGQDGINMILSEWPDCPEEALLKIFLFNASIVLHIALAQLPVDTFAQQLLFRMAMACLSRDTSDFVDDVREELFEESSQSATIH